MKRDGTERESLDFTNTTSGALATQLLLRSHHKLTPLKLQSTVIQKKNIFKSKSILD